MVVVDTIIVKLEAQLADYNAKLAGAQRLFDRNMTAVQRAAIQTEKVVGGSMGRLGGALAGVSAVALARHLLGIADQAKNLDAQLRLATAQTGSFGQATEDVRRIAEATRSGLTETAKLYGNFVRNAQDLGIAQADAARATETVAKTFKISGATSVDAAQGTRQLVQALQSGVLRGDEFNSVMEAAPRLTRLLASSLDVPIGSLRKMAEEGELTSDKLVRAFTDKRFTDEIDAEFKRLPVTFDQAMEQVHNAAIITFGAFDRGGEFSTALANFIMDGTGGFKDLETSAENLGIEISSAFAGLGEVFRPLWESAKQYFGLAGEEAIKLRDQLATWFDAWDAFQNAGMSWGNKIKKFENDYLGDNNVLQQKSDTGGTFRRGNDARDDALRSRQIWREGQVDEGFARWMADPKTYNMFGNRRDSVKRTTPKKTTTGSRTANAEVGRDWSAQEVAALLRSNGVRVTGVDRTAAQQQAQIDLWNKQEARKPGSGAFTQLPLGHPPTNAAKGWTSARKTRSPRSRAFCRRQECPSLS
jgi:tape measure domain-containing protein